jgi:hypothetical protein
MHFLDRGGSHLLDREAPGLTEKLRSLSADNRRRILTKIIQVASETIVNVEPAVELLLMAIASNQSLSEMQVAESNSLAEAADEQYFTLQGRNRPENEWLPWFFKARLLSGIAAAFGGDSANDAADAVYELSKSRRDASSIFAAVESEMKAVRQTSGG